MTKFRTLYYPYFEPPHRWLRKTLLFYDTVNTIVPERESYVPTIETSKLLDIYPDALQFIKPSQRDLYLSNARVNWDVLNNAFKIISNRRFYYNKRTTTANSRQFRRTFKITFDTKKPDLSVRIHGYTFLHDDKISPTMLDLLTKHNLILPNFRGMYTNIDYHVVDASASNLIVSLLASHFSNRFGLDTITDKRLYFQVNVLSDLNIVGPSDPSHMLGNLIINLGIPSEVEQLSTKEYLKIRKAFSGIRESFQLAINELVILNKLKDINDTTTLRNAFRETLKDLGKEVKKARQTKFLRRVTRWIPFSLSGTCTIAAAATATDPTTSLSLTSLNVIFQALDKVRVQPRISETTNFARILADAQQRILSASVTSKLYR